jgi:hypothetical protein
VNQCKTCVHWQQPKDDSRRWEITRPVDQDTYEPMKMPFEVRQCTHPKLLFCERPVENPGFAVADGSEYWAGFYTTEEFGCALHESVVPPSTTAKG